MIVKTPGSQVHSIVAGGNGREGGGERNTRPTQRHIVAGDVS